MIGATEDELRGRLARETRTERIELRVSVREKEIIVRLAKHFDVSVARMLVTLAELSAESILDQEKTS